MSMDLGAYAAFIVPAYGITIVALGGTSLWVWSAWRAARAKLASLEKK